MFGLLGKKLNHSFSKDIHETMVEHEYKLFETDDLKQFFTTTRFSGLNVTIPYKKDVIPYLDELSTEAQEIGVVNTIVNHSGKLIGYNTDYYGLQKALELHDISVSNKHVIILGNGSTSRTIQHLCKNFFAKKITVLARNPNENEYHFSDVDNFKSATIVFNATPVGMFPNNNQQPLISLNSLPNLVSVMDVVYNPLRSTLLIEAEKRGIKAVNGLFMLICQAIKAIEIFHNTIISHDKVVQYYEKLRFNLHNIAFIGMPMSGKTFFAKKIATSYNKEFIDLDDYVESIHGISIPNIFTQYGESTFRLWEANAVKEVSKQHNKAISCGGGVILNEENITALKQNSIIVFIDVTLPFLKKCNPKGRPLLKDKKNLDILYHQRKPLYQLYADITIHKDTFDETITMQEIEVKLYEYFSS
jgi:shikimate dehydrogenase